jgi:3-mercaptopyruvate sulfurtransferase SseA
VVHADLGGLSLRPSPRWRPAGLGACGWIDSAAACRRYDEAAAEWHPATTAAELVAPDGRLRSATELRKWFLHRRAIGGQEVGAYCGGGVSSSLLVFAAATIRQPIGLYVASWSAWSANANLPVEQGTVLDHSPLLDTDCA